MVSQNAEEQKAANWVHGIANTSGKNGFKIVHWDHRKLLNRDSQFQARYLINILLIPAEIHR